jgi:Holliday junction resolvase RusA-like endonuclease
VRIVVPGTPVAQPRQRHAIIAGHVHNYTPSNSPVNAFKAAVRMIGGQHIPKPIDGPVGLVIDYYLPRPKRLMRKCDPEGPVPHTAKPDADNLCKSVMDAWRGLAWRDDSQVCDLHSRKWYAEKQGQPRVEIEIVPVEQTA